MKHSENCESYRRRQKKLKEAFKWACLILAYLKFFTVLLS